MPAEKRTELMRKARFDEIRSKINFISPEAVKIIDVANPTDILAVDFSFDNPVSVLNATVVTPDDFLQEVFS